MRRGSPLTVAALLLVPHAAWAQGNPIGPEFRVNTYTPLNQGYARVGADSAGNFVVVWRSSNQDGSLTGIFGQRYASAGVPVGPEFRVNTNTVGTQDRPSVTADSSGSFVVVWQSDLQDGSDLGVFGQRYDSSGTPLGPEFRVNTFTTSYQVTPSVAADPTGNFVVVWTSDMQDGSGGGVFGQRYDSSGAALGSEFRVNSYTTGDQIEPAIAFDAAGNLVVVWQSFGQDGSQRGVFGQRYASSGTTLGSEFRVNTYTTGNQVGPDVAFDGAGTFIVVWTSLQPSYNIFGQRFAGSGAPLGPEFRINTYSASSAVRPSVAADASGNFVVVWENLGQDGSLIGVFGQRHAGSGIPEGPEFRVNTYTTDSQFRGRVASDASGNFVVIWSSDTQDGSGLGVYGQRYSQIVPVELMHFRVE